MAPHADDGKPSAPNDAASARNEPQHDDCEHSIREDFSRFVLFPFLSRDPEIVAPPRIQRETPK